MSEMPIKFQQAWQLLSRAVDIDNGRDKGPLELPEEVLQLGVLVLHDVYYAQDGRRHPDVAGALKKKTDGAVSKLLHSVIDQLALVENWDRDTWLKNYGFEK